MNYQDLVGKSGEIRSTVGKQDGNQLDICGSVEPIVTESDGFPSLLNGSSGSGTGAKRQEVVESKKASGRSAVGDSSVRFRGGSMSNRFKPYSANPRVLNKSFGSSDVMSSALLSTEAEKSTQSGSSFGLKHSHLSEVRNKYSQSDVRQFRQPDVRPLLHLQAAYIKQVKEWVKHKDTIELLMDVYAQLDSDVVTKEFGRKEFLLRDETGSIYASYYEIDTPMLYGAKNIWLKLSCVWRTWGLQVVVIRFPEADFMDYLETRAMNGKRILEEKLRQYGLRKV